MYSASDEERMNHMNSVDGSILAENEVKVDQLWSDHEVLSTYSDSQPSTGTATASVVRGAVQIAALCLALRSVLSAWKSAMGSGNEKAWKDSKKDDDLSIGLRV